MFTVGIGTIFFTLLSKILINPDNKLPTIIVKEGEIYYKYFDKDVADNFPTMLIVFAIIVFTLSFVFVPFFYIPDDLSDQDI